MNPPTPNASTLGTLSISQFALKLNFAFLDSFEHISPCPGAFVFCAQEPHPCKEGSGDCLRGAEAPWMEDSQWDVGTMDTPAPGSVSSSL